MSVYIDLISERRVKSNWGDTLFRKVRYFNTSMEIWTHGSLSGGERMLEFL